MIYIGIDCSKDTFNVALLEGKAYSSRHFENQQSGFQALLSQLPKDAHLVMEATGPYYLRLATFFYEQQIPISVVNPLTIKRFTQMRLSRIKSDKADAILIAQYGQNQQPPLWQPPIPLLNQASHEMTLVEQLIKQRTALVNQQHAFNQLPDPSSTTLVALQQLIEGLNQQINLLEKSYYHKLKQYNHQLLKNLCSIPGIGPKTACQLIVLSKGFSIFSNYRQLISFVGLAPRILQSGTSIKGRGSICKMGTSRIRTLLYMCALQARKKNLSCCTLFERLRAKGKPFKVAMIAVANKLLKQVFAIAKSGQGFDLAV